MARYAKAGDYHIAYVVEGKADMDLLWVPTWISQCEHLFTEPSLAALGSASSGSRGPSPSTAAAPASPIR